MPDAVIHPSPQELSAFSLAEKAELEAAAKLQAEQEAERKARQAKEVEGRQWLDACKPKADGRSVRRTTRARKVSP
jgi:hypothetical protein